MHRRPSLGLMLGPSLFLALCMVLASLGEAGAGSPGPIGGTRDRHGCLPAAGYTWCARLRQCVRPWEMAATHGFANTPAAFKRACRPRKTGR